MTLSFFFNASRFSAKVPYLTVPKVASCRILHSSPSIPSLFRLPNTVEDLIDSVTASVLSQLQRRAPAKKLLRANLEDRRSQHQPAPLAKGGGTSGAPQKAGTNPSISQSVRRGNRGDQGDKHSPSKNTSILCESAHASNAPTTGAFARSSSSSSRVRRHLGAVNSFSSLHLGSSQSGRRRRSIVCIFCFICRRQFGTGVVLDEISYLGAEKSHRAAAGHRCCVRRITFSAIAQSAVFRDLIALEAGIHPS